MAGEGWFDRLGRIAGIGFVVLFLADVALTPGEPDEGASAASLASYYVAHRGGVLAVSLLHALAGVFFLVFVAAIAQRLRTDERVRPLARLAGWAGVATVPVALMSYVCAGAAAYLAGRGAEAGVVQALAELRFVSSTLADVLLAVFLAAGSAAMLGGAVRRPVLGWMGVSAAAALLLGVAGLYSPESVLGLLGFLGTLLFALWVVVACAGGRRAVPAAVPTVA